MTDLASTSPYASKIKKPSPIKSSGIPKLAISPVKSTKLPTSKPVTRTVSASTRTTSHSRTTGQLAAPVLSDDNPPNTPASPSTPNKSPNGVRKSVGGAHRLHTPNAKESSGTGIPSYAKSTFTNSTRQPASSIPAPRSILKKAPPPTGVSGKAAAVTHRLTSTQPLPPAKTAQAAGKHGVKQSASAVSKSASRISSGSKGSSEKASAHGSTRTSRQGSVGSVATAALPASPELASILAQAQAAQAQVAEVQEQEASLHGRTSQRHTLGVNSRGHSRAASNVSNASNVSANSVGSVLSPHSGQHDSLLDEHDLLDDIDVDTSFDDIAAAPEHAELSSAPLVFDESQEEAETEADGQQQQYGLTDEPAFHNDSADFAATDDTFDIFDPATDNNLVETLFKPAEHEEKTQDTAEEAAVQEVEREQDGRQSVIITASHSAVQERRSADIEELSATLLPELEEKEDSSYQAALKSAAQLSAKAQVADPALDAYEANQTSGSSADDLDFLTGFTGAKATSHYDEREYEEEKYQSEDGAQAAQQTVQPASDMPLAADTARVELITDQQAEADKQQADDAQVAAETARKQESAATTMVAQPAPQASQFTTIIVDRDTNGSYENTVSPLTRTPAPTVTEQPKKHAEDATLEPTALPTRAPAPSDAAPIETVESQPAAAATESSGTPVPSAVASVDTLSTAHSQPSASTLESAIRTPAASTGVPASSVKSVAFSDEVIALGEGKEERSESLDFADDLSLPTTPMRGSVIDHTADNAVQPITSHTQAQTDNTAASAAAASVNRLKQLEAERRADEDKRKADKADEADAKRAAIDTKEAAIETQRVEQQQQQQQVADDKVRDQLDESKRSLFAQMREGLSVTKLGKKGSPRDTRIFIAEVESVEGAYTINWDSKSKKAADAKMLLSDCRCVVGCEEGMFVHRKYAGKYDNMRDRCVSVVSAVRGLDVVLQDEEAVNRLVAMLRLCGCPVREN